MHFKVTSLFATDEYVAPLMPLFFGRTQVMSKKSSTSTNVRWSNIVYGEA